MFPVGFEIAIIEATPRRVLATAEILATHGANGVAFDSNREA
jgi:hypothetical protein